MIDTLHLKFILPFIEWNDALNLLCSSQTFHQTFIRETRQITISSKGLYKFLKNPQFVLNKIVDPSRQLSINFYEDEWEMNINDGKEVFLESVQQLFPYFMLTPDLKFPPLLKLSCIPPLFLYLCERYPSFIVKKLEILPWGVFDENFLFFLAPHLLRVTEELTLYSWPIKFPFPQLSTSLLSLSIQESTVPSLPPLPQLKHLHLMDCDNTDLDLRAYPLETLELTDVTRVDFSKIPLCQKLEICAPLNIMNVKEAKEFQHLDLQYLNDHSIAECVENVKVLKLEFSERDKPVNINLSQFMKLERFELTVNTSDNNNEISLVVNGFIPPKLKFVILLGYISNLNMSWFSKLYEISLYSCDPMSLFPLRKVPRVILCHLNLHHLTGLGSNDYVEVNSCNFIDDFSPLKYVREVKIESCSMFCNADHLSHVKKLSIVGCWTIEDLSTLVEVKELYLRDCPEIVHSSNLDHIPNFIYLRCKSLDRRHKADTTPIFGPDFTPRIIKDSLSKLPDSIYWEITLKYLKEKDQLNLIICNTHSYQLLAQKILFYLRCGFTHKYNNLPVFTVHSKDVDKKVDLQIPSTTKTLVFESCRFDCTPSLPKGLQQIDFDACRGMANINDFYDAEEVNIRELYLDDNINLAALNKVKRLTLDECETIGDFSPLQNVQEINIRYSYEDGEEAIFKGKKAFSHTKKIKLFFDYDSEVEIDLAFYHEVEVFDVFGGKSLVCNGPCPINLRKLYLSRLESITFPPSLSHLQLFHLSECPDIASLQGLGLELIPSIKLSYLPDLISLEGLGPANQFVQLIHLSQVEDFSPVSRSRKVVIWDCPMLQDATFVEEVTYLVIGKCPLLFDVSMLETVTHLELIDCKNIRSVEGLEDVKELIVENCRLLENFNNTKFRAWSMLERD